MKKNHSPDARLCSAVPYLKRGGRIVDVGTDHAYLPIYLVQEGISACALACDINRGPIEVARANISEAGLTEQISVKQTDGLHGTESFAPDDVLIFGMGGELIVRILSEAPWIQTPDIGLVLQPMSRANILRRWLLENGFEITDEALTFDGKYYQTVVARFAANPQYGQCEYSEEELLLGRKNLEKKSSLLYGFAAHELQVWENILRGKRVAGTVDVTIEERMIACLKQRLEDLR